MDPGEERCTGSARGGITRSDVEQLTRALDGKLNFGLRIGPGNLAEKLLLSR